jgi:site-specific recombinase XerD
MHEWDGISVRRGSLSGVEFDSIKERSKHQALTKTVQDVIDVCNRLAVRDGKPVKAQTRRARQQSIQKIFRDLEHRTAFEAIDPFNLTQAHIVALVDVWLRDRLSARTIVVNLSSLRIFCRWVGYPDLVKRPEEYVADAARVRVVRAMPCEAPELSNIDLFDEKWNRVMDYDECVGHQLLAIRAFGLKVDEAICFKPHLVGQDGGLHLRLGSKEERSLVIPLDTDDRRQALVLLQAFASRNKARGGIADKSKSREAQKKRFHYVLGKCGITLRDTVVAP